MNKPPCYECHERTIDCHGRCRRYKAWLKVNDKLRRKRQEAERLERWRTSK